jgi:hypothetical protein
MHELRMQQVRITFFGYWMNAECIRHHDAPDFGRRRLPKVTLQAQLLVASFLQNLTTNYPL